MYKVRESIFFRISINNSVNHPFWRWKCYDLVFHVPLYFHTYFLQQSLIRQGYHVSTTIPWDFPDFVNWYPPGESMTSPARAIARHLPANVVRHRRVRRWLSLIDQVYFLGVFARSRAILSRGHVFSGLRGYFLDSVAQTRQYCFLSSCALEARMTIWQATPGCDMCEHCELRVKNLHYCHDHLAQKRLRQRQRFSSGEIATGAFPFTEAPNELMVPFLSCSPEQFHPNLEVPDHHLLRRDSPDQLLILHAYAQDERRMNSTDGLNTIKGTDQVLLAVDTLKREGLNIKLVNLTGYNQQELRYLQVQADLCIDELRYGWWGSTPLECAALGVPTIVYINYLFASFWQKNYPEYATLIPFLSADTNTITDVLRLLCLDAGLRAELRRKSLRFAQAYLDPDRNARVLARALGL